MPVILEEREQASWLERELPTDEVRRLLDRHPEGEMTAYPVSRAVNDSRNEGPELIEPLAVQR
jgi:putative SOS response-associated peptidase YedK